MRRFHDRLIFIMGIPILVTLHVINSLMDRSFLVEDHSYVWCRHQMGRHQMETFLRYWPFVRGIYRSPVNSAHKGQWNGALMFSLIWINSWVSNHEAGKLRHHRAHYDVTVMPWDVYNGCICLYEYSKQRIVCKIVRKRKYPKYWRLDITLLKIQMHDDVMIGKRFPHYWSFVRGIQSLVHKSK